MCKKEIPLSLMRRAERKGGCSLLGNYRTSYLILCVTTAVIDRIGHLSSQIGILGWEIVQSERYAILPMLVGVARDINAFLERQEVWHIVQHSGIVLNGVDTQHGWRFEIVLDNLRHNILPCDTRCFTLTMHHVMIEPIDIGTVLFPPSADA